MNNFSVDEQFNCSFGCSSANQCEYNNARPTPVNQPGYVDNGNFFYGNNYDDGVVPPNHYEAASQYGYQNYSGQIAMQTDANPLIDNSGDYSGGNYFIDTAQTYPPCQGPQPWNFAQCYGYFGEAPCQFSNVVDMEDFM